MPPPPPIEIKKIAFPDIPEATLLFPTAGTGPEEIIKALSLPSYNAVLLLIGGADSIPEDLLNNMKALFNMGIGPAIQEAHAIVLDGGTKAGVMELIGNMAAASDSPVPLIGVAPRDAVSWPGGPGSPEDRTQLEPHHPMFVLPEGKDFGDETKTLFNLFGALCHPKPAPQPDPPVRRPRRTRKQKPAPSHTVAIPGIVILAGGRDISRKELLHAVRGKYQIIVIKGSGGLADTIATAWEKLDTEKPQDPEIAQILEEGDLEFHSFSDPTKGITRLIIRSLGKDKVLTQAWQTFARYDRSAGRMQKQANLFQIWIILIGFLTTSLAVIHQIYPPKNLGSVAATSPGPGTAPTFLATGHFWYDSLTLILILLPILITILLTAQSRFKSANKWLLLRSAAEMLKQEIYRYRTRLRHYGNTAQADLAKRLADIASGAMSTEVNTMALSSYADDLPLPPGMEAAKGGDDGFSMLTPERYIQIRIGDQLSYFNTKIPRLDKQYTRLTCIILIISGGATLLSALNQAVWLTVTTAAITALGTYLAYRQTDSTRTKYNQTQTNLEGIQAWWNSLSHEQQSVQTNIDMLVDHTEHTLQAELDGWVQQMRNALERLTKELPTSDSQTTTPPADKDNIRKETPKPKDPAAIAPNNQPQHKDGNGVQDVPAPEPAPKGQDH